MCRCGKVAAVSFILLVVAAAPACRRDGQHRGPATEDQYVVELGPPVEAEERPYSLVLWSKEPLAAVTLPQSRPGGAAYFFRLYQGPRDAADRSVDVMVVKQRDCDLLWLDLDNDQDLGDDGGPIRFPADENGLDLELRPVRDDPRVVRAIRLERIPNIDTAETPQGFMSVSLNPDGSLRRAAADVFAHSSGTHDYVSAAGHFYAEKQKVVSPGTLIAGGRRVKVGFVCLTGRFGADNDALLVDVDGDGHIPYLGSPHLYGRGQPFEIGDLNLAWTAVDPYGRSVTITAVESRPHEVLGTARPVFDGRLETGAPLRGRVGAAFWKIEMDIQGGTLTALSEYRGHPVLFSFWGEWCPPCREELPQLAALEEECRAAGLQVVGLLQSQRPQEAVELARAAGLHGPQLLLSPAVEQSLAITAYPTNLLVLADGQSYVRMVGVDSKLVRHILGCNVATSDPTATVAEH